MAANYRAVLEYDGTAYAGFQIQAQQPTIQGTVEAVLARLCGEQVRIAGAGRTDAGVHARGQVLSFQSSWRHDVAELQRAMNALLPADIAVRSLALAADDFHARYSAIRRTYIYSLYQDPTRSPLRDRYAWQIRSEPDLEAMRAAAECLLGYSDCAAFGQDPRGGESTRRWIYAANFGQEAGSLRFELTADAFLRGMVRRIVGNLVQVGMGQMSPTEFREIQRSGLLARSAPPAPACGLCLWHVQYEDNEDGGQAARDRRSSA
ncbi:MAG: tRNA pseudouridine(38-40) synthase TruA [Anaerolineae bacterium]